MGVAFRERWHGEGKFLEILLLNGMRGDSLQLLRVKIEYAECAIRGCCVQG